MKSAGGIFLNGGIVMGYYIYESIENFIKSYKMCIEENRVYTVEEIVDDSVNRAYGDTKRILGGIGKYENKKKDALTEIKKKMVLYLEGKNIMIYHLMKFIIFYVMCGVNGFRKIQN